MNYGQWLAQTQANFRNAHLTSARLDAILLLEHVTHSDRAHLLAHQDEPVAPADLLTLAEFVQRRLAHEPIAYIVGECEFYGRRFAVTQDVLVPRPETETMIDLALELTPPPTQIIDVGTGSGCIAVTMACALPNARVLATDNDPNCIRVAQRNATAMRARVTFMVADLTEGIAPAVLSGATILANLPYIPAGQPINTAATHEPPTAIFGSADGLQPYRRLFSQLQRCGAANQPLHIVCESLLTQHGSLQTIAARHSWKLAKEAGLQQVFVRAA